VRVSQLLGLDVGPPVSTADQSLASSGSAGSRQYEDVTVGDRSSRVLTQSLGSVGGAIQVARELSETSRVLGTLAFTIAVVGLLVLLVAAFAGWLVARQITRRLTGLTEVVERVSSTGHLDVEIPAGGRDEVGRLSTSLQAMLSELARSRDDQHRLLQNAGHELRTPLTSLRTNVSVMRRFDELSPTSQRGCSR
jgi:two-component system sensor histidine kinase MprB